MPPAPRPSHTNSFVKAASRERKLALSHTCTPSRCLEERTRNAMAATIQTLLAAIWRMSRADTFVSSMHQQGTSGDFGAEHSVNRACCTDIRGGVPCKMSVASRQQTQWSNRERARGLPVCSRCHFPKLSTRQCRPVFAIQCAWCTGAKHSYARARWATL